MKHSSQEHSYLYCPLSAAPTNCPHILPLHAASICFPYILLLHTTTTDFSYILPPHTFPTYCPLHTTTTFCPPQILSLPASPTRSQWALFHSFPLLKQLIGAVAVRWLVPVGAAIPDPACGQGLTVDSRQAEEEGLSGFFSLWDS